jgi:hypothetical protein
MKKYFDIQDLFVFGGIGLVTTGLWMVYPPIALIIPGLFFVWLGLRG